MKRIGVFLSTVPHSGGAFQYSQAIIAAALALPKDTFEVVLASVSDEWEPFLRNSAARYVRVANTSAWQYFERVVTLLSFPVRSLRTVIRTRHPAARQLSAEQCDLWFFPAQDAWSYLLSLPALGAVHDLMHHYESRFPEVSAYGRAFRRDRHYRGMCAFCKGIVVDSSVGKDQLVDLYGVSRDRVHVLPYIAPLYMKNKAVPAGFDDRYNLPPKYIFYPAQFWEHKNHRNLIMTLAQLREVMPDISLVLAGSIKNAYERILALTRNLHLEDQVRFLGYVPDEDMPELYRRARALVMPTYFGPTNIPPLEAFEAGCPVAVSRIYGMPEQVGDAALMFDPDSIEDMAHAVRRLWTDDSLCRSLSEKGALKASRWQQPHFDDHFHAIIQTVLLKSHP